MVAIVDTVASGDGVTAEDTAEHVAPIGDHAAPRRGRGAKSNRFQALVDERGQDEDSAATASPATGVLEN